MRMQSRMRLIHSKGGGCIRGRYADASGSADDVYEFVSGDGGEAESEEADAYWGGIIFVVFKYLGRGGAVVGPTSSR